MTGIDSTSAPIDQALLPASIRNGSKERKEQYESALAFERTLVSQMTTSMMKTASIGGDDESGDAATKIMKDNIPSTLTDAIMGAGGLGLAQQLDAAWHPEAQPKKTSLSDQPSSSTAATGAATGQGGMSA